MANNLPGGDALANQLAHNVADGAAHNQATIDQLQHSLAEGQANIMNSLASNQASLDAGWAQEAQRAQGLDAVFNSLNGPTPGIVPGLTPGFENAGPQMGMPGMEMPGMGMPPGGMTVSDMQHGPQMAMAGAPMMDVHGMPMTPMMDPQHMPMLDGQTPGLQVSQSLHHNDGEDVVESLLGFDLDSDAGHQVSDVHSLEDAIHLAQETGQVVVIEEVTVIDPGAGAHHHDHSGGDFSV